MKFYNRDIFIENNENEISLQFDVESFKEF